MSILKSALLSQWRGQRWVLLAAAGIGVLCLLAFYLFWPGPRSVDVDFRALKFFLMILWYAAASSAGALAFAVDSAAKAEAGAGKSLFWILLFRMFIGLTTLLLACAILILVPVAYYLGGWDFHGYSSWFILECADLGNHLFLGFLLAFGSGAFISSRGCRLAGSILSSAAISVLLFVGVSFCWLRLDLHEWPSHKAPWILACVAGTAVVLLAAAFRISTRYGPGDRKIRGIVGGFVSIAVGTVLVSACFMAAYMLTGDGSMELYFSAVTPSGREVLVSAHSADGRKDQIWVLPVAPGDGKRLVLRQSFNPVLSPDGSSIVYFSQKTWYGLISQRISLRYCRIDGSGDTILVPDFTEWVPHEKIRYSHGEAFSPDGTRVAMNCGQDLYVASPAGMSLQHVKLDADDLRFPRVLGFGTGGEDVLLRSDYAHRSRLLACSPLDGRCNILFESESLSPSAFNAELSRRGFGQFISGIGGRDIEDLERRIAADPGERLNYKMCLSPDRQTLLYTVDSDRNAGVSESQIHLYRMESGTDEMIAAFPGKAGNLVYSPSGGEIAVSFRGPRRLSVVLRSGRLSQTYDGWDVLDWVSDGEVLLMQRNGALRQDRMGVGDTATGRIRTIYP